MMILYRIGCLALGYCFGLFQTAFIYGKMHGIDIREHGSGNAGTTNALRTLGGKAGIIVLLGDMLKCFLACMLVRLIFYFVEPDVMMLMEMYTGLGVALGHIFPFYMNFKGGKGIAVAAGLIASTLNPWIYLSSLLTFVIILAITKYVSVGSIVLMIQLVIAYAWHLYNGYFDIAGTYYVESIIVLGSYAALAIFMHRANIKRLINHEENKFSIHKSEKKAEE